MYKDNLNKENVIILDELLKICIKDGTVTRYNLPNLKDKFIGDIPDIKYSEYRSYLEIIDESGKAKVDFAKDNFILKPINGITREFLSSGGYTAIIEDQLKEIKHQELLKEKDKIDVEISKFNRDKQKTYYTFTVVSFILSLLAIGISIYSMFKS